MTSHKAALFPSEHYRLSFVMQKRCIIYEVGKELFVSFRWTSILNGIHSYTILQEKVQISVHEED